MATKTFQLAIDAAYKGGQAFAKADADIKKLEKESAKTGRSIKTAYAEVGVALGAVGVAFGATALAAKSAYEALAAGAVLADARGDFEDLTAAIGTTADAMLGSLRNATGGLVTDAQLIADASNMMATGLGLTEAQIVAFSGAAAQLDWNLETLTDTLNTGSTRGLKEMGLSISFVKTRMAELEAQGVATDEAFRMAILEAADKKIEAVGKKSEETAGQLVILATAVQNVQDEFNRGFAEGFAESLADVGASAAEASKGASMMSYGFGSFLSSAAVGMTEWTNELYHALGLDLIPVIMEMAAVIGITQGAANALTREERELAEMAAVYERAGRRASVSGKELSTSLKEISGESKTTSERMKLLGGLAQAAGFKLTGLGKDAKIAEDAMSGLGEAARAGMDEAKAAAEELAAAFHEAALEASGSFNEAIAALGDIDVPDLFSEGGLGNADALNTAIYEIGTAAGASVSQLFDLGVATGQFAPQAAEAAAKAVIFQQAVKELATGWQMGAMDTSEFLASVDEVINTLETQSLAEIEVELKAKASGAQYSVIDMLPEGDRAAIQEGIEAPVEFTPVEEALRTAIETIKADIDAIDGTVEFIPEYKSVTPGATSAIQGAITAIDGTVPFQAETRQVWQQIYAIDGTHATVYVDFVSTGSAAAAGGGGPTGKSGPLNKGGNSMVVNINGVTAPRAVARAVRNSVEQFYADLQREEIYR